MKRRILASMAAVAMSLCIVFGMGTSVKAEGDQSHLVDGAGLLSAQQFENVAANLDAASAASGADIVVVTVDSLGGKGVVAYADDYFDNNFVFQGHENGVLLLIAMDSRDWCISTAGNARYYVNDTGNEYVQGKVLTYLKAGDYEQAFIAFGDASTYLYQCAAAGQIYGAGPGNSVTLVEDVEPKHLFDLKRLIIAIVAGLILSSIPMAALKREIKNVSFKSGATDYVKSGSFNLTHHSDRFLYRHVDRRERPKESSSGGTSHTHTSSGGVSHGGSHGKF